MEPGTRNAKRQIGPSGDANLTHWSQAEIYLADVIRVLLDAFACVRYTG